MKSRKNKTGIILLACAALLCGAAASCSSGDDKPVTAIGIKEAKYVTTAPVHMEIAIPKLDTTVQLTPFVLPHDASNATVSYSSSMPEVLSVSATGLITPVAAGTDTTFVVSATDGSGVYTKFWVVVKE